MVDPTIAEEQCSIAAIVIAISNGSYTTVLQAGSGSLDASTLVDSLKLGKGIALQLDKALMEILQQVRNRKTEQGIGAF